MNQQEVKAIAEAEIELFTNRTGVQVGLETAQLCSKNMSRFLPSTPLRFNDGSMKLCYNLYTDETQLRDSLKRELTIAYEDSLRSISDSDGAHTCAVIRGCKAEFLLNHPADSELGSQKLLIEKCARVHFKDRSGLEHYSSKEMVARSIDSCFETVKGHPMMPTLKARQRPVSVSELL